MAGRAFMRAFEPFPCPPSARGQGGPVPPLRRPFDGQGRGELLIRLTYYEQFLLLLLFLLS